MPGEKFPSSMEAAEDDEDASPPRLADFVRDNVDAIVTEWQAFAATLKPAADLMSPLQLRNHIRQMLDFLVRDMEVAQSSDQELLKSQGKSARSPETTASELHAALRLAGGFNISQMVSEFRALRASIMRLWGVQNTTTSPHAADMIRFNESIDQMISETVLFYSQAVRHTQDLFLGVIGHDLRNPVMAVMGCADLLPRIGPLNDRQVTLCHQASESADRIVALLDDLVDLTRARLGAGLQVVRVPMDASFVVQQIAAELRVSHPDTPIDVDVTGVHAVEWDKARFGQLVSNLLSNAIQYSFPGTRISIAVDGTSRAIVTLSVHNTGLPIPVEKMPTVFEPFTRAASAGGHGPVTSNLGLGLFIAKDIATAHGGTLTAISTEMDGTTFTASLPRTAILVEKLAELGELA
jgi:signal transduction histidine kinase